MGPARTRVALLIIILVVAEKNDPLEFSCFDKNLKTGFANISVCLGFLVPPGIIGQAGQRQCQADDGHQVPPYLRSKVIFHTRSHLWVANL